MQKMINEYVKNKKYREALDLPDELTEEYKLLAQGEYNVNYVFVHPSTGRQLVFRVNCGSQMHLTHQIDYEANALRKIEESCRTPQLLYVDGSDEAPGNGILVEEYFGGKHLDYRNPDQLRDAAQCLADIHSVNISGDDYVVGMPGRMDVYPLRLIAPENSYSAILDECEEMVKTYMESDLALTDIKSRLRTLLDNAWVLAGRCDGARPYSCCINTELNSSNFIVGDTVRLVDWEKPLYGDPAQDLGHFLAPTTTFWKSDVILTPEQTEEFIDEYIAAVDSRYDTTGLRERTLAFIPITCLRGITWCAMAMIEYKQSDTKLINESTRIKLKQYMSSDFITMIELLVNNALKRGR